MTTILEPAAIVTEEIGAETASVFGLPVRIPMFLPGGAINP